MDLAISSSLQTYKLPLSCCSTPTSPQICDDGSRIGLAANIPVVMYQDVSIFYRFDEPNKYLQIFSCCICH